MKRFTLALTLALPLTASLTAQERPYLQNLSYYVENTDVYGERQEEGRTFHIPADNISLDGIWKFLYCDNPSEVPADFFRPSFNDRKWADITVPSNWEMQGFGQALFRNCTSPFSLESLTPPQIPMDVNPTGAYRKTFSIPSSWKDGQVFIRFEKVASAFFLWVNGSQAGYNEGAQEPSEFNITEYIKPGRNVVSVMVLKYSDGYYLEGQDYWRLAGIFDDVTLFQTPNARIWDYQIITDFDASYKDSEVSLAVDLKAYGTPKKGCSLEAVISKDGKAVAEMSAGRIDIGTDDGITVNLGARVPSPLKWTADTPDLYDLSVCLTDADGRVIDSIAKKMGFKKTEIRDGVFLLNGQPIKVNAENSHMQHPLTGHTMDEATIRKDMEILKQFGFNAVRTSHYPPVNEYLDLADRYGLYIIDETGDEAHATEWVSERPEFTEMYRERARQMVLRDRNHACVLFWSAGNESGEGKNISEVVREGKKYDPTRFWMYGGNGAKHEAEDIVGPRYPIPIEHETSYGMDSSDKRPSFMDEYASVAGNGGGGFDDFWREIYAHESLLGGAVWDFVSPGLLEPVRSLEDKSPNAAQANIMGRAKLVPGPTGLAIDFNVTDQWVQVYREDKLEINGDRLTLTLDIFPRRFNSQGGYLITKGSRQFGLRQRGRDKIEFYIDNGDLTVLTGNLPSDWEGRWHNVCAVYDSEKMSIYIDSKEVASGPASGAIRNLPLSVCIGRDEQRHGQETDEYIADALMDNVGIFTDAVRPEEGFDPDKAVLWLDFEKENLDGSFYSYGIGGRTYGSIWPDRTPQPEMYQMKKSTQPFSYRLLDSRTGAMEICNRGRFLNASHYSTAWAITADADTVASGILALDIEPATTRVLNIPYTKPEAEPGKEYRLTISTTLADDEIWAGKGHEIAWEQFELSDWNIPAPCSGKPSGTVELARENGSIIVSGDGFRYSFNADDGTLCSMTAGGKTLLTGPLALNLWRAPLSNELDDWNSWSMGSARNNLDKGYAVAGHDVALASMYYTEGLDKVRHMTVSVDARAFDNSVFVDVRELAILGVPSEQQLDAYITSNEVRGIESIYSYRIDADGTITLSHHVNPQGDMPSWLPRLGVCLSLDKALENVQWYGRGPQASYPDRKTGYRTGFYSSTVGEMYEPYLIPQDYGLRMDNRWVRFTDSDGTGLQFSMNEPFSFNAYPFTTENLTKSIYTYQLRKSGSITVNLDYVTSGVGCTARGIFAASKAPATGLDRTVTIKLIR